MPLCSWMLVTSFKVPFGSTLLEALSAPSSWISLAMMRWWVLNEWKRGQIVDTVMNLMSVYDQKVILWMNIIVIYSSTNSVSMTTHHQLQLTLIHRFKETSRKQLLHFVSFYNFLLHFYVNYSAKFCFSLSLDFFLHFFSRCLQPIPLLNSKII